MYPESLDYLSLVALEELLSSVFFSALLPLLLSFVLAGLPLVDVDGRVLSFGLAAGRSLDGRSFDGRSGLVGSLGVPGLPELEFPGRVASPGRLGRPELEFPGRSISGRLGRLGLLGRLGRSI